jgi:hypothetical protein
MTSPTPAVFGEGAEWIGRTDPAVTGEVASVDVVYERLLEGR